MYFLSNDSTFWKYNLQLNHWRKYLLIFDILSSQTVTTPKAMFINDDILPNFCGFVLYALHILFIYCFKIWYPWLLRNNALKVFNQIYLSSIDIIIPCHIKVLILRVVFSTSVLINDGFTLYFNDKLVD